MMTDPLRLWTDACAAGFSMAATGARFGQMMLASGAVISHRSRLLADAWRKPLGADHREFGRMMSEKQDAFRQATSVAAKALCRLDQDLAAGPQATMTAALSTMDALIDPYHRRSTANAKRLARTRR